MTAPIAMRALRPDGSQAARGLLVADVIVEAVRDGGAPWHILQARGWRVEMVPGIGRGLA